MSEIDMRPHRRVRNETTMLADPITLTNPITDVETIFTKLNAGPSSSLYRHVASADVWTDLEIKHQKVGGSQVKGVSLLRSTVSMRHNVRDTDTGLIAAMVTNLSITRPESSDITTAVQLGLLQTLSDIIVESADGTPAAAAEMAQILNSEV